MNALLEAKNLHKQFPISGGRASLHAVNSVSLHIERGETLGLVGESGSGKTTVGRCIIGLIPPTTGSIRFAGEEVAGSSYGISRKLRGKMQLVFQEPFESLDPRQRIRQIIEEPLIPLRLSASERRTRIFEAIDRVGLDRLVRNFYPGELSAGQQQRVGIARAMITRPELVILDEPTSALDPSARSEIIELLMKIQKELHTAYLFISHDLSTVRFISHRVAVMYLGMIVEQGSAVEVFMRPRHPYSIGLLSSVLLPNPRIKLASTISLKGEIPSPINLPLGCFLASRCPFAIDKCRQKVPPLEEISPGHWARCIRHQEVAAEFVDSEDRFATFYSEAERILDLPAQEAQAK